MLNKVESPRSYKLHSLDGEIGKVKEFYFDDHHWTIRYLVVDTGNLLLGTRSETKPVWRIPFFTNSKLAIGAIRLRILEVVKVVRPARWQRQDGAR